MTRRHAVARIVTLRAATLGIAALCLAYPPKLFAPDWTNLQAAITPGGGMSTWQNTVIDDENDCIVAVDLENIVTNGTRTYIRATTVEDLTHTSLTETLDTYWQFVVDGDTSQSAGVDETGATNALGHNTFVGTTSFLSSDVEVEEYGGWWFWPADDDCQFTIASRGHNLEDSGSDSDATEAPETGDYEAELVLFVFTQ